MLDQLKTTIEAAFEARDTINGKTQGDVRDAVDEALAMLDCGEARVAEKLGGEWHV
ncbi:MAG: 2,3,4,5-tetrahydropyridine-2,6-dicarboxylate N-succinyltransferase, partial [Rhodomicrobium sp.]|nr:2,3,4,5-tetrahydropyridine-2,6-dicarboxylate N-succinyltransferase [Rhodomicrobium sp.]